MRGGDSGEMKSFNEDEWEKWNWSEKLYLCETMKSKNIFSFFYYHKSSALSFLIKKMSWLRWETIADLGCFEWGRFAAAGNLMKTSWLSDYNWIKQFGKLWDFSELSSIESLNAWQKVLFLNENFSTIYVTRICFFLVAETKNEKM